MLNVQFPFTNDKTAMILFHLDMQECCFHGSACQVVVSDLLMLEQMHQ
jgi:hypothetical protein